MLTTNSAGAYTTNPLVLGRYSVKVNVSGFKTSATSGILLTSGDVVRHDVKLDVGDIAETVEVTAADSYSTRPDVSHKVDEKYYHDLPVVTAADVRLAESVLLMQPGYLPMTPNGDPMFRGSQFGSRINGGQTRATENFFDGGAFGYASGHQQSQESAPPVEAIQEVTVVTTTYSAQYGHTSGGFIEYTSKSGANKVHGSAYTYLAKDSLNTQGFFKLPKTPLDNKNFGIALGGPIIKNKTFFFVNIDWTKFRSGTLEGFGNTTPVDAFKAGDFSALLGPQIGVDVLGRPILQGQIYNPSTTRVVNGIPVRDPYPGNIIPGNDPLRSNVAAQYAALMVHPDRPGLSNNVAGNPAGDQTWELDAHVYLARIDHTFSPKLKAMFSGYYNNRPSVRNCGGAQGCSVGSDPLTDSASNTDYIGEGFTQRIYTTHAHTQWDWIINNNLMSHTTVAWDRWYMGGASLSAGANWPQRLWGSQQASGLLVGDAGPPQMNFAGNIPYNTVGLSWPSFGYEKNDRWQFSTDLAWVRGKSTIKVGFEYRHHKFPHQGWAQGGTAGNFNFNRLETGGYDASGNNLSQTGDPFASFMLGQVHDANQYIYAPAVWYESYVSPWINAEFKLSSKLTVTAGLRLDYQTARTEANDNYSTFDPNTPNPGAGGRLGAVIFAGSGPGRTGSRTFETPKWDAWGPRLGFSYRINESTTVRGGYGMYYAGVAFSQFTGDPNLGFSSNPSAVNVNNGQSAAFLLDSGFPQQNITLPPFIDPTIANGGGVPAVSPDGETLPRFQNWSLSFERRLTKNMMLDVSYIGNRGSRLNHHGQRAGLDYNMNDPRVLVVGRRAPEREHQFARGPGGRDPASLSGLQRKRRAGAAEVSPVPEHRMEGAAARQEPVPRTRGRARAAFRARAPVPHRLHLLAAEEQRRGERAGQRREQRRRSGSRQLGHGRLRAQPGRHAARVPGGLHVGHRERRLQDLERSEEGHPRRLEPERNTALRGRPTAADHHGQRHGWLALQHTEATEPHGVGWSVCRGGLRPAHGQLLRQGRLAGPGSAHVRQRAEIRRNGARIQGVQRRPDRFQELRDAQGHEPAVRGVGRQRLQPDDLLRTEHELQLVRVRHGQHAVQPATIRAVWLAARLLRRT